MPASIGPGRYKATSAPMSAKTLGFSLFTSFFMPPDSSWNTASVSPLDRSSNVSLSSRGILLILIFFPVLSSTKSRASLMMVKVSSPKKSIFKSPIFSIPAIGYCVSVDFSFERVTGIISLIGLGAIITPAAWVPVWFFKPSMWSASSTKLWT